MRQGQLVVTLHKRDASFDEDVVLAGRASSSRVNEPLYVLSDWRADAEQLEEALLALDEKSTRWILQNLDFAGEAAPAHVADLLVQFMNSGNYAASGLHRPGLALHGRDEEIARHIETLGYVERVEPRHAGRWILSKLGMSRMSSVSVLSEPRPVLKVREHIAIKDMTMWVVPAAINMYHQTHLSKLRTIYASKTNQHITQARF